MKSDWVDDGKMDHEMQRILVFFALMTLILIIALVFMWGAYK